MGGEQIEDAYRTGFWKTYDQKVNNWEAAHLSGLREIAQEQIKHDAEIADKMLSDARNFPFSFLDGVFVIERNAAAHKVTEAILTQSVED